LTETTHGQVFTWDALHCQKQTTTVITKSKNDYIIPLKRNQKKLFKAAVKISESQLSLSESQTVDISHGFQIVRKVSVFDIEPLKSADFDGSQWGQIQYGSVRGYAVLKTINTGGFIIIPVPLCLTCFERNLETGFFTTLGLFL